MKPILATSKIKKGDTVRVIAGVDKGKEGKVLAVKDGKVKVEGINKVKMHIKPNQSNAKGGIVEEEAFFDVSNVMYVVDGDVTIFYCKDFSFFSFIYTGNNANGITFFNL